jgi:hypothetical protein
MTADLTTDSERDNTAPAEAAPACKSWSFVLASLLFSAATYEMLVLYGIVHWQIMFRWDPTAPRPPEAVFVVLGHLARLRAAFAILAFVWAVWSFRACPRWASVIALIISLVALMTIAIVM